MNITEAPAVVTIGRFTGGNRSNIVPEAVELEGTIRAFDEDVRKNIQRSHPRHCDEHRRERRARRRPWTFALRLSGDAQRPALTERMLPTLRRVAGAENVRSDR